MGAVNNVPSGHGRSTHQWKRGPVTDFTVTYECECGDRHKVRWASILPHVSAVDMKVMDAYGGTVIGEAHQTWEYTLSRWMQEIDKLGLRLHTEDLTPGEEEELHALRTVPLRQRLGRDPADHV